MTASAPPPIILFARGLGKAYGPFKAVDAVDLDVHEHDIHVFIGKRLGTTAPSWRARAGIGRSFQLTSIVPGFSCLHRATTMATTRMCR